MPKLKLDSVNVLTAYCEDGKKKTDWWDTHIRGLTLEVRRTGGRTFYLRYQDQHGRQRQHKICAYGDLTVDKVRKEAQRLRSEVVLGGDPAGAKETTRAIPTYAELAERHLAHARTYQRAYGSTEMNMRRHILPRWGKLRLSEIRQADVALWLAEKTGEGLALATVEKIRVTFGRSFELALQWDMPGVGRNPTRGIKRPPINNARDRYINAAETKRLMIAAAESRNRSLPAIVGLLLTTGARVSELLNAEWSHIDVERRSWLIPTSKTGKSRHVPLSQPAIEILERLPRVAACPFLLPNPRTMRPFTEIKHAWQEARDRAKLPGLRIHDLRHSSASAMVSAGIDLFAVGRILGHADHKSTMRYSHLANDTLLAAVEAGATKLQFDWARNGL